ncbi:hypothetical protein ABE504_11825 [Paenibacillus oryzisoli]|uniref:hypothetical protein n=1 Tax=Paenibacillus oryzisoli TaxID=1850517 RepID=UPI003D2A090D
MHQKLQKGWHFSAFSRYLRNACDLAGIFPDKPRFQPIGRKKLLFRRLVPASKQNEENACLFAGLTEFERPSRVAAAMRAAARQKPADHRAHPQVASPPGYEKSTTPSPFSNLPLPVQLEFLHLILAKWYVSPH